ncbi:MAG: hypothetical protein ABIR81_08635, partial [Ginsengibacter sp.]
LISRHLIDAFWTIYATYILRIYDNPIDPGYSPPLPIIVYLIGVLVVGLTLIKMSKRRLREIFSINKSQMLAIIAASTAITLIWITLTDNSIIK